MAVNDLSAGCNAKMTQGSYQTITRLRADSSCHRREVLLQDRTVQYTGHSSMTPIYLYRQRMTFDILDPKTHPQYVMSIMMLNKDFWTMTQCMILQFATAYTVSD